MQAADEGTGANRGPARHGTITLVHGGGNLAISNTNLAIGGDRITVTGGGGAASPLVVYGDTSQDGLWYSGATNVTSRADNLVLGAKLFDQVGTADDLFRFPRASAFDFAGHDVIDASALFPAAGNNGSEVGITVYGGAGNDTLTGTQLGDHLAGGSGNDLINGQRGIDLIYGDSGFNVDPFTRTLIVPVIDGGYATLPFGPVRDSLAAGSDTLNGDAGDDVIFGDHGVAMQDVPRGRVHPTYPAAEDRQAVFGYATGDASNLQFGFDASDKLLTTNFIQDLRTAEPGNGADDEIHGNAGRDRIFGGKGSDTITGDAEPDVIFGDQGHMSYLGPDYFGNVETGLAGLGTLDLIESVDTATAFGSGDTITDDGSDDIIIGGQGGDTIDAGAGQNIVFGDHGRLLGVDAGSNTPVIDANIPAITQPDDDYQMQVLGLVTS
ncbi:MAG: calcium-binding protein, partial [Dongiaceae bacterium]